MNRHRHEEWTDQLSAYMEGDLDPAARERLEAHLGECVTCREVLAELRTVVELAREADDLAPPTDLWPALAAAMRSDGAAGSGGDQDVIALPTGSR